LAFLSALLCSTPDLDAEIIFIAPNIAALLEVDQKAVVPLYRTLQEKRLYGIPEIVLGLPFLARFQWPTMADLLDELYFHWEYYACKNTPFWRQKLGSWGTLDDVERQIVFPDEEAQEAFFEVAAYEFDEQPLAVLGLSHGPES
jgi:hypothetical protein